MNSSIRKVLLYACRVFLVSFLSVHALNCLLIILSGGFWDGGLSVGIPKPFYVVNCGMNIFNQPCHYGLAMYGLIIDVLFWFAISAGIAVYKLRVSKS